MGSEFKQNEMYQGTMWNLEVRKARAAIRKAPAVYFNVILEPEGDGDYVEVTKAVALRALANKENGTTTSARVLSDGRVFFN